MKKFLSVLLVLCCVFGLVGCEGSTPTTTTAAPTVAPTTEKVTTEPVTTTEKVTTEPVTTIDSTSTTANQDPVSYPRWPMGDTEMEWEFYRISNPESYQNKPILVKGDKYYLVENSFESDRLKEYKSRFGLGESFYFGNTWKHGELRLFSELYDSGQVNNDGEAVRICRSYGPAPMLSAVKKEGDSIILYSSTTVPRILLFPYIGFGHGMNIDITYDHNKNGRLIINHYENEYSQYESVTNLEVRDCYEDGRPVIDNIYNLDRNKVEYELTWFSGTQFNREFVRVDCQIFCSSDYYNPSSSYIIEGALTKDGYAKYNLEDIPIGLYRIQVQDDKYLYCTAFLRIKNN